MALSNLTVLIVEDHELVRQGLAYTLQENGVKNVLMADNGQLALQYCGGGGKQADSQPEQQRPDVVLMDIGLPVMDGIRATQRIKQNAPDIKVIMLTSHQDPQEVRASLAAGADGYCLKDIPIERLCRVMEDLMEGGLWLDPSVAVLLQQWMTTAAASGAATASESAENPGLTERETEVLAEIVNGKSNKEIAVYLGMSPHTVKTHVTNIIQKLAVSDRTQAAVKAVQQQLV
ncbi:MAG: response regulator transcription factor [Vampirovibrionales bacterium]